MGRIFEINSDDDFVMNIILDNIENLLEYVDYDNRNSVKRIIEKNIKGFISLDMINNKYYIRGLIIYRAGMVPGTSSIVLLYGISVKMREKLILHVIEKLSSETDPNKLTIYSNSYDGEDSYVYMDLGFKYVTAKGDSKGKLLYVTYVYGN